MLKEKPYHRVVLILFINLILFSTIYGQVTWQKTYGWDEDDRGRCIKQTSDGGYILAGDSDWYWNNDDKKLYGDILLMKLDTYGDTLWTKKYGGTYWDEGHDVLETEDNGFLVLGSTDRYGPNGNEVYLIKTDSNGDTLWTKKHGRYESDFGYSILKTNDNGYIIAGATYSLESGLDGSSDAYIIRIDSLGNKLWEKIYGGPGDEGFGSILQTNDGDFLFAGSTSSFGNGLFDIYIFKTNLNGDTLWTKTYGDTFSDGADGIVATNDGGFIIGGDTEYLGPYGLEHNILILKTDSLGNLIWEKEYNMSYADITRSIQPTKDGGYIIAGLTITPDKYSQALLMKLDENGDSLWTRTFGFDDVDQAYYAEQTSDGGYILTGFSEINNNEIILIVKTDTFGYITGLNDESYVTEKPDFLILRNYPNPFNQQTVIFYQLPLYHQNVSINIYNTIGQKVNSLFKGKQAYGTYKILWDGMNNKGQNLPSGIYFIKIFINGGQFTNSSKLLLIR
jgi:hypothetical protein